MAIKLGLNIDSAKAGRALDRASNELSRIFERLSSGQRINRAGDDAAGLAVATSLRSRTRVYTQAMRNINDAQSALNVAESGLSNLSGITMRLRELATQAANGSFTVVQRRAMDEEADALVDEFNRIVSSTRFNGLGLLDGSVSRLRVQAGYGEDGGIESLLNKEFARNVPDDTYRLAASLGVDSGAQGILTADFNNDGRADIAVRSAISGNTFTYLGNGDGTFSLKQTFATGASNTFYSGDFNGDGNVDLATIGGSNNFTIALGQGDGTFTADGSYGMSSTVILFGAVGDLNGDGRSDLVSSNGSGGIAVRFGQADGTLSDVQNMGSGLSSTTNVVLGDVNGDGALDILGSSNGGYLFTNSGSGTFTQSSALGLASALNAILDADGDGFDDIMSAGPGKLAFHRSNGDGTFQTGLQFDANFTALMQVADLNGDGLKDLVGAGPGTTVRSYSNGDGTFTMMSDVSYGSNVSVPAVADYDGDGAADIAVITIGGTRNLRTYLSNTEKSGAMPSLHLNTRKTALESLGVIDTTLERINREVGELGGIQARLRSALNTITAQRENGIAAESRIMSADVAEDAAALARTEILRSAAGAIMAQANQQPSLVLKLLKPS